LRYEVDRGRSPREDFVITVTNLHILGYVNKVGLYAILKSQIIVTVKGTVRLGITQFI
jgi:hypothetical protein